MGDDKFSFRPASIKMSFRFFAPPNTKNEEKEKHQPKIVPEENKLAYSSEAAPSSHSPLRLSPPEYRPLARRFRTIFLSFSQVFQTLELSEFWDVCKSTQAY